MEAVYPKIFEGIVWSDVEFLFGAASLAERVTSVGATNDVIVLCCVCIEYTGRVLIYTRSIGVV